MTETPLAVTSAPLDNADILSSRVDDLQKMLLNGSPMMDRTLFDIHSLLAKNEALTHLLSEEQIGVIVKGLSLKKNLVLAEKNGKGSSGGKSLKNASLDDI